MRKLAILIIMSLLLCGCAIEYVKPLEKEPMHRYEQIEDGIYNWERFPEVAKTPVPHY